ncbi:cell division FtsA domain-containing protein [Otoolea muris]|uniref:cell division FtsA domain-containing protein n=1 Tax=Otoolea muris TaxID=2941515 RepID=UPI00203CE1CC|nr:cell division FtsA domain-containing protein [Otoolea muris]
MAKGRVKKTEAPARTPAAVQPEHMVFALDIGTRSLIGMVGTVEDGKVKIIAIEREEHAERAMVDGQIEDIEKVAGLAKKVKKRLESRIHCELKHVCVAAAGRALRTKRAEFELELPGTQLIDDEIISRLEAGAIGRAEDAFEAENSAEEITGRFYLVGYTVCQYYLDQYMISSLKDHRGRNVRVDLIATFLPSEVVESLYTTMHKIGLDVASITLEPIAAINAAIPENLRLLNLVMVDIGAGTSDIAACMDGSVTGYTMATVAGDEITEAIMKKYLVDFETAETIKAQTDQKEEISFTDILGIEQCISREELLKCIEGMTELLSKEIAQKVLDVNGGPPSALFLAGGGSKLAGLKERITEVLQMDENRVAIAGNNFRANAFSDEYDLNNPEYATPLGIVISSGLNLINDSFRVTLNNRPAKLFRSGSFTALNLLMMNGFNFQDILGRSGLNITVMLNGRRKVFYGTSAQPASLFINKKEGKLSDVIHAGDIIDFMPAISGESAKACLGDVEGAKECLEITLNGAYAPLKTPLKNGDVVMLRMPDPPRHEETDKDETQAGDEDAWQDDDLSGNAPGEDARAETVPDEMMQNDDAPEEDAQTQDASDAAEQGTGFDAALGGGGFDAAPDDGGEAETEYEDIAAPESGSGAPSKAESPESGSAEPAESKGGFEETSETDGPENAAEAVLDRERGTAARETVQAQGIKQGSRGAAQASFVRREVLFYLNGSQLRLPRKPDGDPYYLMDMLEYSGIDLKNPKGDIKLTVNGRPGLFQQKLSEGDTIFIGE